MLNSAETARRSTNVSLSLVPSTSDERETGPLPSLTVHLNEYVLLCMGQAQYKVSSLLMNGYLAACKAYCEVEQTEYGAYIFLTGYEYAHLTRQYVPGNLSTVDKREWQRGFVAGWNACTFGLNVQAQ